jgi:hypothetical protein
MEVAPLLKAAGEGKVVPPPRVATLEGGPAYPATKVATQVICTKGGGKWCRHQESNSGPADYKSCLSYKCQHRTMSYSNEFKRLEKFSIVRKKGTDLF